MKLINHPRFRSTGIPVLAVGVTLLFCSFVLPGGAPAGVMVSGLAQGAPTALLAAGLVLIWRSTRIINFAQAVLGAIAANLVFNLGAIGIQGFGLMPFFVIIPLGLALAVGTGMLIELAFVRRFFNSPRLVLTVVTVVAAPTLASVPFYVELFPFWTRGPDTSLIRAQGQLPVPFADMKLSLFPFTFGFGHVFALVTTVLVFIGLGYFLTRTAMGTSIRAAAGNPERALMLGLNIRWLSTVTWGIAGFVSGLAAINSGLTFQFGAGAATSPEGLLGPLAAAVLGRMRNLPVTIASALTLGILGQALSWSYSDEKLILGVTLTIILGGLLLQRNQYTRDVESGGWEASKEIRPTPAAMMELSGIRRARAGLIAFGAVVLVVFPQTVSPSRVNVASLIAIIAIVTLSMVILTGWGGQVSLGQYALVAVGALAGGKLTGDIGVPFLLALPLACAATSGFALLVGQPALRLRGPFLAVTTLTFAVFVNKIVLDESLLGALAPATIERPKILFVSFASERAYYYLCLFFAVLAAIAVRRLRAGRTGRVLIALRDNDFGVQPFGINSARARLSVFALAGAFAGLAGVLLAHHARAVEAGSFTAEASVQAFIVAMVGGITSVSGAILGAVYFGLTRMLVDDEKIRELSTNVGLLYLLFVAPGGLASVAYHARDSLLRIIAVRRKMLVPSLFEDIDPEAVLRRKAPLEPAIEGRGLDAVPADQRYSQPSRLYPTEVVK